jgi:hypothetical protein
MTTTRSLPSVFSFWAGTTTRVNTRPAMLSLFATDRGRVLRKQELMDGRGLAGRPRW